MHTLPDFISHRLGPHFFITIQPQRPVMAERWPETEARATPVTDGCVWCKQTVPTAVHIPVGADEYLCPNCLGDLREWGRFRQAEIFVTAGLEPALQRIVLDHWDSVRAELCAQYDDDPADLFPLPTRKSNADTYEQPANSRTSADR